jgi:hypothetical protein
MPIGFPHKFPTGRQTICVSHAPAQKDQGVAFCTARGQPSLKPISIAGNPPYRIDPNTGDFYKRSLICAVASNNAKKKHLPPLSALRGCVTVEDGAQQETL